MCRATAIFSSAVHEMAHAHDLRAANVTPRSEPL